MDLWEQSTMSQVLRVVLHQMIYIITPICVNKGKGTNKNSYKTDVLHFVRNWFCRTNFHTGTEKLIMAVSFKAYILFNKFVFCLSENTKKTHETFYDVSCQKDLINFKMWYYYSDRYSSFCSIFTLWWFSLGKFVTANSNSFSNSVKKSFHVNDI